MLDQLEKRAHRSGEPFGGLLAELVASCYPQKGFQDDNWFVREISVDKCYFAHDDFRGREVPKDGLFVDFMRDKRQQIESGTFPCSSEINARWSGQMPPPLVQERGFEKYYVLDGQLRVIRHWYHNVLSLEAFIYKGQLSV